jgi:hypothetical protein
VYIIKARTIYGGRFSWGAELALGTTLPVDEPYTATFAPALVVLDPAQW